MEITNYMTGEEYNHLRETVDWRPISLEQAKRGLQNTTFLVVVREEGKAIAMGRALFDYGYTAYIGDVIVKPEYQGKGIGKSIVNRLIDYVKKTAIPGTCVEIGLTAVKGKEPFYEQFGFVSGTSGMKKWIDLAKE